MTRIVLSFIVGLFIVSGLDAAAPPPSPKMPMTKLLPAKRNLDQCTLRYRITTRSQECQDFFDQGLGYLY